MHKTGTTSLQALLAENRNLLLSEQILYPDLGLTHHGPLLNVRRPEWSPDRCSSLLEWCRRMKVHTILLSGEIVSTFSIHEFRKLEHCFPECDLQFVFCFRHWVEYWP